MIYLNDFIEQKFNNRKKYYFYIPNNPKRNFPILIDPPAIHSAFNHEYMISHKRNVKSQPISANLTYNIPNDICKKIEQNLVIFYIQTLFF